MDDDPKVKKDNVGAVVITKESNQSDDVNGLARLINYHLSWHKLRKSFAWINKVRKTLLFRVGLKQSCSSVMIHRKL
jgi:hypothetical protein